MLKLITGKSEAPHVTSADDGELYKNLTKQGDYVFAQDIPNVVDSGGTVLNDSITEKDVSGNITVDIVGGAFLICSRFARNIGNSSIELPAGIIGESIVRYICLKYTMMDGIESTEFVLSDTYENNTTIYDGATEYLMPIFAVNWNGTVVTISNCYKLIDAVSCVTNDDGGLEVQLPDTYEEKSIVFKNPEDSENHCNVVICGGSADSITPISVFDKLNNRRVWGYTGDRFVDSNANLLEKNAISVYMTNDVTLKSTNRTKLSFDKTAASVGSRLVLKNGSIVIGAGIKCIKVGGSVYFYTGTTNATKTVEVVKTTESSGASNTVIYTNARPQSDFIHIAIPEKIISVSEGDSIDLHITAEKNDVIKSYHHGTFLTVEVMG